VTPEDFGLARANPDELRVDSPEASAALIRSVLAGEPGAARDIVVLNAAAGVAASGAAESIGEGVKVAEKSIDSGAAGRALDKLVEITRGD
jgi:anthranilate phosphoribosyltransferase